MPLKIIAEKFNAYFSFTRNLVRYVHQTERQCYIYPNDSMISDLTVLWALFSETCAALESYTKFEQYLDTNLLAKKSLTLFINTSEFEFWASDKDTLYKVDLKAVRLGKIARTLRNGFAHFHWRYEDLSAKDYWEKQKWGQNGPPDAFNFIGRTQNNYMLYIADADVKIWNPLEFWQMKDLRIVVTKCADLRYHLHLFLNNALNNLNVDVFGNQK